MIWWRLRWAAGDRQLPGVVMAWLRKVKGRERGGKEGQVAGLGAGLLVREVPVHDSLLRAFE